MSETKIISLFPHQTPPPSLRYGINACMPRLFNGREDGKRKISFIDIKNLKEETLLDIIALNMVSTLIDLRLHPVFSRPKFHHKNIIFYLEKYKINYVEYAFLAPNKHFRVDNTSHVLIEHTSIKKFLDLGLTICIYDDSTKNNGWLDNMRQSLRIISNYFVELNPRSLVREK